MKILQIIPNIGVGGAERFVVDLSNKLVKRHDVTLITLYDGDKNDLFSSFLDPDIKIRTLGKQSGFDLKIIKRFYQVIKEENPDIIHTHLRAFNYLMPLIPLLGKTKIVHTVHNDAFRECTNAEIRYFRKLCFKKQNVYPVTISKESDKTFEKAYVDIEKTLIYNGRQKPRKSEKYQEVVDKICSFKKNNDTKIFVNIGRQEVQKNQLMLVEAFCKMVNEDGVNAVLLIMGGGRNNEASRKIQHALKIAEQKNEFIHLLGERRNATDYLYASDYFCLPSLFEGMPITLIEAFATGTVPVCTPVGGVREMVSELDRNLLSNSTETDSYYELLKHVSKLSDAYRKTLKEEAEKLFEKKYSIQHCATVYEELYKRDIQ